MKTRQFLWLVTTAVCFTFATVFAETANFDIGGTKISAPSPEGYFRCDGKNPKFDGIMRSSIPVTNRLLAVYSTEDSLARLLAGQFPKDGRSFMLQSSMQFDSVKVSPAHFSAFKESFRSQVSATDKELNALFSKIGESASTEISEAINNPTKFKIGDTVMLGVFDETTESVCYTSLMKAQFVNPSTKNSVEYVTVTAACSLHLRDKMVSLYCSTRYLDKTDFNWVRSNLTNWRDAILSAN
jgi:hypothetical protein